MYRKRQGDVPKLQTNMMVKMMRRILLLLKREKIT